MPVERDYGLPSAPPDVVHKLACPDCGETADLGRHVISDDGKVLPSVTCPMCEFHADVELEHWPAR